MDNSLRALCDTIKKLLVQLKPHQNSLSFILLTGTREQGKTSLLKQSSLEEMPVLSDEHAKVYFNSRGIIVELGENWLNNHKNLLQNTLKQLNKCNRHIHITGIIQCIDINDLLVDPHYFNEQKKRHLQWLEKIGANLGYGVELALIFTKMDTLAGFSEFYQMDHAVDLAKPLGFSLDCINQIAKKLEAYEEQFNHLVETQGQQVIHKMHPARSTIKRSLIREFPLQLASLRLPIRNYIQSLSPKLFHLQAVFFTSATQGGISVDRLNKKIEHEYALVVQDTFMQATNFRAYFVEGALKVIQERCTQIPQIKQKTHKQWLALLGSLAGIGLLLLTYQHFKTAHLLDEATKELLAYDMLINQSTSNSTQALYHLAKASNKMDKVLTDALSLPTIHQLKTNLHKNTQMHLKEEFMPALLAELEQIINNASNTPLVRYKALKTYIMLGKPNHFNAQEVLNWFQQYWQKNLYRDKSKRVALLQHVLKHPLKNLPIKPQVIRDARNYLNALPSGYLFYSLAKEFFPAQQQRLFIDGFTLASLELPYYYTKAGYEEITKKIPTISASLQKENWVLARQDIDQLQDLLLQTYCYDYVTWWQTFMRKSAPHRYQDYQQGRNVTQKLKQARALTKLIALIQQETKPDIGNNNETFNKLIASKFTDINLLSVSVIKEMQNRLEELEHFIATLSVINDEGKTAFTIAKSRYINPNSSDPITLLFNQAQQLPPPIESWVTQIAGDTWTILLKDARHYINQQWQNTVYREFQNTIAKRYPFYPTEEEIAIADFNRFFATHGLLNAFTDQYLKPFLDVSTPDWKPKALNNYMLPIAPEVLDELIRANIITNMFFPNHSEESRIAFTLQKINLDPVIATLRLKIGKTKLVDTQTSDSYTSFTWPQNNAKLSLDAIDGNHYELAEEGTWAIFKLLEKVNVLVDEQDSTSLQILFEVNSNSGRYLLKTHNQVNPFTPGILNGFTLDKVIV